MVVRAQLLRAGFEAMRRALMLAVDPSLFTRIQGSTDFRGAFHLALTFGLEDDPVPALERAIGFVEETDRRHDIAAPMQASMRTGSALGLFGAGPDASARPQRRL
jgi:hypothetical protein